VHTALAFVERSISRTALAPRSRASASKNDLDALVSSFFSSQYASRAVRRRAPEAVKAAAACLANMTALCSQTVRAFAQSKVLQAHSYSTSQLPCACARSMLRAIVRLNSKTGLFQRDNMQRSALTSGASQAQRILIPDVCYACRWKGVCATKPSAVLSPARSWPMHHAYGPVCCSMSNQELQCCLVEVNDICLYLDNERRLRRCSGTETIAIH
jgi:hypothetical protein